MRSEMTNMRYLKQDVLYEVVFKEIKQYIIDNNLQPGDKLPTELEMCRMMGVSRNVLREALKSLQMMGIITSIPGSGNIIMEFSFDTIFENIMHYLVPDTDELINEMRHIRAVLEVGFFKEAYDSLESDDITHLKHALEKLIKKAKAREETFEADFAFHDIFYKKIKNRMYRSLMRSTWDLSKDLKRAYNYRRDMKSFVENHLAIYNAIKNDNYDEAYHQINIHFTDSPELRAKWEEEELEKQKKSAINVT
jgi:GntR family transcriptional repressor for pyruvate dehydrogenase complex